MKRKGANERHGRREGRMAGKAMITVKKMIITTLIIITMKGVKERRNGERKGAR